MDHRFSQQLQAMPKLELHIHLEGTFDLDTICSLAQRYQMPLPRPRETLLQFEGLSEFLAMLDCICGLAHEKDDARALAYRYAQYARSQGTVYSEVIVNPSHWKNLSAPALLTGVLEGFDQAFGDGLPDCRLLVSLRREQSIQSAGEMVDWMLSHPHPRLVGLSIDGNEALAADSNPRFAPLFARARQAGLGIAVHAGESSGPEGVEEALDLLHARRIDHGVRAMESPALLERLKEEKIPLNVCFTSNVVGGLYTPQSHPLGELYRGGQLVTVNTDDPMLLGISLLTELALVADQYHWGIRDLLTLQSHGVEAAFCTEEEKAALRSRLRQFEQTLSTDDNV